ncbi:small acidic protein [Callorhinchus milii]|uniref:Small acidic protein n=1 Tax=Callorhinchus milii TaxID=7868 RepID=K4FTA7_CALMI|nr:small acidic protein [Callorhinchus milii]AFK10995.1 small acidic protein [Callorhinchus milii]
MNSGRRPPRERAAEHGAKRPASPNGKGSSTWDSADLGDDERKLKFLRLMGAGKQKDQTGRLHTGDHKSTTSHFRTGDEEKKINEELEHQFHQSLDSQLSGRNQRHCGLGFNEPKPPEVEQVSTSEESTADSSLSDSKDQMDDALEHFPECAESSDEPHQPDAKNHGLKSSYKMMFVKSSTN